MKLHVGTPKQSVGGGAPKFQQHAAGRGVAQISNSSILTITKNAYTCVRV